MSYCNQIVIEFLIQTRGIRVSRLPKLLMLTMSAIFLSAYFDGVSAAEEDHSQHTHDHEEHSHEGHDHSHEESIEDHAETVEPGANKLKVLFGYCVLIILGSFAGRTSSLFDTSRP